MDAFLSRNILPKLQVALANWDIIPSKQKLGWTSSKSKTFFHFLFLKILFRCLALDNGLERYRTSAKSCSSTCVSFIGCLYNCNILNYLFIFLFFLQFLLFSKLDKGSMLLFSFQLLLHPFHFLILKKGPSYMAQRWPWLQWNRRVVYQLEGLISFWIRS